MEKQIREVVIGEREHWFDFHARSMMQPMMNSDPASGLTSGQSDLAVRVWTAEVALDYRQKNFAELTQRRM
ncbi:MAG: hypothetical protein ABI137_02915 [Antricoccus sp.]